MRLLTVLLLSAAMARAEIAPAVIIAIQPLGEAKQERIDVAKKGLEEAFGLKVEILTPVAMPKEAWYEARDRYRAEKLLNFLERETASKYRIVVGLTSKDISTTKGEHVDWGIFGLGELGGRACVISTYRLGARGADEKKLRERLVKLAVHEAGHAKGLEHCPQEGCVMQDAESSIATVDAASGEFCDACKESGQR